VHKSPATPQPASAAGSSGVAATSGDSTAVAAAKSRRHITTTTTASSTNKQRRPSAQRISFLTVSVGVGWGLHYQKTAARLVQDIRCRFEVIFT
jgi:hypothetical protein